MARDALFQGTTIKGLQDNKPARLVIEGFAREEFWITSLTGGVQPNFQLMYAVGPGAFLNAFNQRLSVFQLSGLHVPADCDRNTANAEPAFFTFYKERNIVAAGARTDNEPAQPTYMSFNNITMIGWIVGLVIGEYSKEGIDGHTFQLKFLAKIQGLDELRTQPAAAPAQQDIVQDMISGTADYSAINAGYNQPEKRSSAVRSGGLQLITSLQLQMQQFEQSLNNDN
jgi:hypothetical protein